MMSKHILSGAVFTLFMGLSLPMCIASLRPALASLEAPTAASVVEGKWTPAFEKSLGDSLPVYDPSRNLWGGTEYRLFHEGRKGVLVGSDGWLYTDEEFSCPPAAAKNLAANLSYITATHNYLAQRNTKLVVALIPAKARLFSGHLGGNKVPACRKSVYESAIEYMKAHRIPVADLYKDMRDAPDHDNFFLRTDTHWTPAGAQFAARRIRDVVTEKLPELRLASTHFSVLAGAIKSYAGDLMRYVPGVSEQDLPPDRFPAFTTDQVTLVADASGSSLFDEAQAPQVALVGTSYSANPNWNFNGFLKAALQTDMLNAAEEGKGPFMVMDKYLKDGSWKKAPPRLLIWEIPERYLPMPRNQ
jgi:alginate O-acetyltransferase complex protein AlgJ